MATRKTKTAPETITFDLNVYDYQVVYDWSLKAKSLILKKKSLLPLKGKHIVLTGTLSGFDRPTAKRLAQEMGAVVYDKVDTRVNAVVLGLNPGIKNAKLKDSLAQGAELITDKQFTEMVDKFKKG